MFFAIVTVTVSHTEVLNIYVDIVSMNIINDNCKNYFFLYTEIVIKIILHYI